jgi:hypothetical protein
MANDREIPPSKTSPPTPNKAGENESKRARAISDRHERENGGIEGKRVWGHGADWR